MSKFKDGDLVYCPMMSNKILKVRSIKGGDDSVELLSFESMPHWRFTTDGVYFEFSPVSTLVPATDENHRLLEALYQTKFQKPNDVLFGSELCTRLLETQSHVFCKVIVGDALDNLIDATGVTNVNELDSLGNIIDLINNATDAPIACIGGKQGSLFYAYGRPHERYTRVYPVDPVTLEIMVQNLN